MSDFFKQLGSVLDDGVNALGEGFATLGNSSKEVLAASKMRAEIASAQEQKDVLVRKIGGLAYAAHQEGADPNEALAELYAQIDALDAKLAELKAAQEEHWRAASKPFAAETRATSGEACDCEETCCCEDEGECADSFCGEQCDCEGEPCREKKEEINVTDMLEKTARAFAEGVVTIGQKVGSVATSTFAAVQAGAERSSLEGARRQALSWMGERVLELYHQGVVLDPALACKCAEVAEIDRQVNEKRDAANQRWNAAKSEFTGATPAAPCGCEAECACGEPRDVTEEAPPVPEAPPASEAPADDIPRPNEVVWSEPANPEISFGEENDK